MVDWVELNSSEQLHDAINESKENKSTFLIFKHSTRCSISSMAKSRLFKGLRNKDLPDLYYLDILNFREISNEIAQISNIEHESPQVILFNSGEAYFSSTHMGINASEIIEQFNTKN